MLRVSIDKDADQSNTLVFSVGFYVAIWLYRARLIDDAARDHLEVVWPVNFSRFRG